MRRFLAVCVLGALAAAPALAQTPFTRADYEKYFSPGRFASKSVYYSSAGEMEVVGNKARDFSGRYFLEQTIETIDVSPNYDNSSPFPYYKIKARTAEQLLWDDKLNAYVFEYTGSEFDGDMSRVWESNDSEPKIGKGDKGSVGLHRFYNDADKRMGRNVKASETQYRTNVVGVWVWRCMYLRRGEYDVECKATHQPTQRSEDYSYRKLDLVS